MNPTLFGLGLLAGLLLFAGFIIWLFHDYEGERPHYDETGRAVMPE